jgi:glycosyltransferase involved in cell wall biosynthesis
LNPNHISVVIPTFNRQTLITRALDSVLAQSHQADEIIIVDDGSTDNTVTVIHNHYPNIILLSQENKGVSTARNLGIKHAKGEWIALLDSDDEWRPDKLEKQLAILTDNHDYRICHTNETWIRHGVRVNPMKKHRKYGGYIFQYCLPLCVISPSSVIIHRSVFDQIGLFDESLPACEDYDLWLRICARYSVLYLEEELITKHGGHEDQLSKKYWGMDRFRILALEKIISDSTLGESDRNAAINIMLNKISIYLSGAKKYANTELVSHFEQLREQYTQQQNDHISSTVPAK